MHIPKPPWYGAINKRLEGAEGLVNLALIFVIGISLYLLIAGDRVAKTTWLVYVVAP